MDGVGGSGDPLCQDFGNKGRSDCQGFDSKGRSEAGISGGMDENDVAKCCDAGSQFDMPSCQIKVVRLISRVDIMRSVSE